MRGSHRRLLSLLAAGLAVVSAAATRASAGENYALLVAVGNYDVKELRPLKYTRADVLEFHKALSTPGSPRRTSC